MTEILIITVKRDPRFKLDKDKIRRVLKELNFEIIRIERVRRL